MKKKYLSSDEQKINQRIEAGEISPVKVPRLRNSVEILKYQLCSEIIRYKNTKVLRQNEVALLLGLDKSEVSKIFSYRLEAFSSERLLGLLEALNETGADIKLEKVFTDVAARMAALDRKTRSLGKARSI